MDLKYASYPFTPILGWSISRYELFDKCRRQYFYSYYSKYTADIPTYKIKQLKGLTSVPLETGNVVHDVLEAFLKRLQQSETAIDETRFFDFAHKLADRYFTEKTFIELFYGYQREIDMKKVYGKIDSCLRNFIRSSCYSWIYMIALQSRQNWMIEPAGYGETRLNGLKAYCKMDFLLPVGDAVYILDWKTGRRDEVKHGAQLMGYAAATNSNFSIPWNRIFPRIVYLYPEFEEFEISFATGDLERFFLRIKEQSEEMYALCKSVEQNVPLAIDSFPKNPSPALCKQCRFRELCFPDFRTSVGEAETVF